MRSFSECPQARFWSAKNTARPHTVALNSNRKYWFVCDVCHHEFDATLANVAKGAWYSYCANRKKCSPDIIKNCQFCFKRCFASHPGSSMWSNRNCLSAFEVALGDNRKFWFSCEECLHDFDATPQHIAQGRGCPYCANKRRCPPGFVQNCQPCWLKCFASHPQASSWSIKNEISPWEVALKSSHKFWFCCAVCLHEFEAPLDGVVRGRFCPYCANQARCPIDKIVNCQPCREKTFASHPKAAMWSSKNVKSPLEVSLSGRDSFWFDCNVCFHTFEARPYEVVRGNFCPFCANKQRCPLESIRECWSCAAKCFGSHTRAKCWAARNSTSAWEVALSSNRKYWFKCDVCPHEFERSLKEIVRGDFCPYCSNRKRCSRDLIAECESCWKKCFGSHPCAQKWSDRNNISPYEVALNDNSKFWFKCDRCPHEFESTLNNIVSGNWCPFCVSKKRCPLDSI
jgi:hypothetical protein